MSTGTGSTGGGGAGYRVEVDNLRAFASQVRGLLSEFQSGADASRVHGQSGVRAGAFGTFAEAEKLHQKYSEMRDSLKALLDELHSMIDEAQHKADLTASNYEEQESETKRTLKVGDDGWSLGPAAPAGQTYRTTSSAGPSTAVPAAAKAKATSIAASTGDPKPSW